MKTIVRAFVLSLVATGAYASVTTAQHATAPVLHAKVSAMPVPLCPPGVPDGCHIQDGQ